MKRIIFCVCLLMGRGLIWGHGAELPPGFVMEEDFVVGLDKPTDLKFAPDGRIFIAEKGGTVRIVENGLLLSDPFCTVETQSQFERGLDGLVLDPDFDQNGFVYLYHTLALENRNVVTRVTAAGNYVIPGSAVELIRFDEMYSSWHNGGGMAFDDEGKLIVATGDGTALTTAQDLNSSLGKVHRINPDGSIPEDNPFYTTLSGSLRSIAALGLRNPYTMAKSPSTGQILINDVGNDLYEEVNEFFPGKNYGWHLVEGPLGGGNPPGGEYADPFYAYGHEGDACAVVGASFYEPEVERFPGSYVGKFFFLDLCNGTLYCLDPESGAVEEFGTELEPNYSNLEVSPDGDLYLIHVNEGNLARISYQGTNVAPLISESPASQTVPVGEDVLFRVEATGDPFGYYWFKNGAEFQVGFSETLLLPNVQLSDDGAEIFAVVQNMHGWTVSDTAVLRVVDGQRPVIEWEQVSATYQADDSIFFRARVSDADQAEVPVADWTWKIDFHHDTHLHPAMAATSGVAGGVHFVEPFGEVDTNVFFQITLTVVDSSGLEAQATAEVLPELVEVLFTSEPPGAPLLIDGAEAWTDHGLWSVRNLSRVVEVPAYAFLGDSLCRFVGWSDGVTDLRRTIAAQVDTFGLSYVGYQPYTPSSQVTGRMLVFQDTASRQVYYGTQWVQYVDENWDSKSPYDLAKPPFPDDYWSARWEGGLIAPVSDWYTFFVYHDGRVRLQVGDRMLLDARSEEGLQEDTVRVWLEQGDSLGLVLDYDHLEGMARVRLDWQYSLVERQLLPFSIPFVPFEETDGEVAAPIILFPNPSQGAVTYLYFDPEVYLGTEIEVKILDPGGRVCFQREGVVENALMTLFLDHLEPYLYFVQVRTGEEVHWLKLIFSK